MALQLCVNRLDEFHLPQVCRTPSRAIPDSNRRPQSLSTSINRAFAFGVLIKRGAGRSKNVTQASSLCHVNADFAPFSVTPANL